MPTTTQARSRAPEARPQASELARDVQSAFLPATVYEAGDRAVTVVALFARALVTLFEKVGRVGVWRRPKIMDSESHGNPMEMIGPYI